jgi:hypothetical protein
MNRLSSDIRAILLIRWKQTYRITLQLGIIRLTVLLSSCLFVLAAVYAASGKMPDAAAISGIWTFLIVLIHAKRPDKNFLHINLYSNKLICSVEYIILSIPLVICLWLQQQGLLSICLVFTILGAGFIKIDLKRRPKTLNTCLQQYIPSGMYEWKAGVRQSFFPLIIVWVLGLSTSFFVASIPVAMLIIGLLISDFYKANESWQILLSCQKNAVKILYYKIKQHFIVYTIIHLPFFILFLIFHFELWYIPVIEFIILLSIHIFCILLKYAFYSPDRSAINPFFHLTGLLIGLIPFTTPLLYLFSGYLFMKARTNLYPYLNDYN